MTDKQQPEALRLARWLEHRSMSGVQPNDLAASTELRRLHAESEQHLQELRSYRITVENREARIAELEAELAAAPQAVQARITIDFKQATDLIQMFGGEPTECTLTYGDGHSGRGLYAHLTEYPEDGAGYLGESDADSIPDATNPIQHGLEPIEQRQLAIGQAVYRACKDLPEGAEIQIYLERGAGTVHMTDWDGNEFDHLDEAHEDFADRINAAIDGAIAAEQFAAQAKHGERDA